jgi:hypothetical protein
MTNASTDDLVWHDDGHTLWLELNRSELMVLSVLCPGGEECADSRGRCVVEWFINRFGLECHVGVCVPEEQVRIAWAIVGDKDEKDESQVWVISVTDDLYAAWRSTQ